MERLEILKVLEKNIYEAAGCEFDILSTQQTREILIEKLGLPDKRLELLAQDHKIVADILEYRNMIIKKREEVVLCHNKAILEFYDPCDKLDYCEEWGRIQKIYNRLSFVASCDCLHCKEKCEVWRAVKADLDKYYNENNDLFYSDLCDILDDFRCGLSGGMMDLMV